MICDPSQGTPVQLGIQRIRVDRARYRLTSLTPSSSVIGLPAEERVLDSESSEGFLESPCTVREQIRAGGIDRLAERSIEGVG